ncbi:MAG: OmpA family protein, partial [Acidobacteriota bacterium]
DFNKATLRPQNREILSRIAGVLLTSRDYGVQVFGHTDDVGSVEYNQQLSEQRAATVRDYLVEAGIDSAVLSTTGLGKTSPLVEGTDPESRQRNRRVELAIVFSEGDFEVVDTEQTP